MSAASSSSLGMTDTNATNTRMAKGIANATSTRMSPASVLNNPSAWSRKIVGTTAGGMINPARNRALTNAATRSLRRWITNAISEARMTVIVTDTTVRIRLLRRAVTMMPFRSLSTAWRFSTILQFAGHAKSRDDASAWVLAAVTMMKITGTMNTTKAIDSATTSTQYRRARRAALTARSPASRRTA